MNKLPKAIAELDGGLFVPGPVVDLLEAVLLDHERLASGQESAEEMLAVLAQLRELMGFTGMRPPLPPARVQLGLEDPAQERLRRNLLKG